MHFEDFGRAALACYFSFVALYYTVKLLALRARTGVSHADYGGPGTPQYIRQRLFRIFRAVIWILCVVRVFWPQVDRFLVPITALAGLGPLAFGLSLLVVSLGLVIYLHSYMGDAWRSAVGQAVPQRLIIEGPFSHMRHPMFTAVGIGQLGFFLALPSLFSLVCLVVGVAVLIAQGRFEEARLAQIFGDEWRAYARDVPAVIPRFRTRQQAWPGLRVVQAGPVATGRSSREPHSAQEPS